MDRERDDGLYAALARQYQMAQSELAKVEAVIRRQEAALATAEGCLPEAQAEAVLSLLDDVARITADPAARAEVNPLVQAVGLVDRLEVLASHRRHQANDPATGKRPDGFWQ